MLQARENLMEAIQAFLKKYDQIPPKEKSMDLLQAKERFLKIKQDLEEEHNQPENIQELLLKLINYLQILNGIQLKQEEQAAKDLNLTPSESEDLSEDLSDNEITTSHFLRKMFRRKISKFIRTLFFEFDEEIISSKIDPLYNEIDSIPQGNDNDHFNAESNLIESLLNRDTLMVSSPKINSLLEEFSGELAHIDSIPPGIDEADFDPKEDIRLIEKLLNDDSSPEELNSEIPDAIIESFSLSPIPVEDSDSFKEEIDIFLALDDSIPPGIKKDDYNSEGDLLFLKELLNNVPNVLPTLPTLYPVFDTLLPFSSENEDKVFNPGILISKEEKSPHLLSHRGFKVFQLINDFESSMMIYGEDIPILDF
ncbi:hypothetical protein Tco_0474888 [Tanacetum coccineum]